MKERDERPDGVGRPEQRDSDCIDPATGLPMFLTLPKDVAWPPELPVYGSTVGARVEVEPPIVGDGEDGMELVWPKYVKVPLVSAFAICKLTTLAGRRIYLRSMSSK